jgi:hypothetical protein
MVIRAVEARDAAEWERMRQALWPSEPGRHAREIALYFKGGDPIPPRLLALNSAERMVGFAEMSIRSRSDCLFQKSAVS